MKTRLAALVWLAALSASAAPSQSSFEKLPRGGAPKYPAAAPPASIAAGQTSSEFQLRRVESQLLLQPVRQGICLAGPQPELTLLDRRIYSVGRGVVPIRSVQIDEKRARLVVSDAWLDRESGAIQLAARRSVPLGTLVNDARLKVYAWREREQMHVFARYDGELDASPIAGMAHCGLFHAALQVRAQGGDTLELLAFPPALPGRRFHEGLQVSVSLSRTLRDRHSVLSVSTRVERREVLDPGDFEDVME